MTAAAEVVEGPSQSVRLDITRMTCASCATRIEKRLNKLDGVEATVNYATEQATVRFPAGTVSTDDLLGAVAAIGYAAELVQPLPILHDIDARTDHRRTDDMRTDIATERHQTELRQRLMVSAALSLPVVLLSMVPALQFDNWQWLALTLASPVVVWGGWPFHRAACSTPGTGPRPWTRSSRSAPCPHTDGRSTRCSSATPAWSA